MIRMHKGDILRYGDYSRIGESIYNHPFQWGSKRTGPDLAREGGLRSDGWHYNHMIDPRSTSEGSIMPSYHWMADKKTDFKALPAKIATLRKLGVPYDAMNKHEIEQGSREQALQIAQGLVASEVALPKDIAEFVETELTKLEEAGKGDDKAATDKVLQEATNRLSRTPNRFHDCLPPEARRL